MYTLGGELNRPIGGDKSGRQTNSQGVDRQGLLLLALSVAGLFVV